VIKRVYYAQKQKNLPMYYATAKNLTDFTTTESHMNKGQSRYPTINYRSTAEDLFEAGAGPTPSAATTEET